MSPFSFPARTLVAHRPTFIKVRDTFSSVRFEKRIEEGLTSLAKMAGTRAMTPVQLSHRVGRLMGQNTRAAGAFKTELTADPQGNAQLKWEKVESWRSW